MEVDEARRDDATGGVEVALVTVGRRRPSGLPALAVDDLDHDAVVDADVGGTAAALIDDGAAGDQQPAHVSLSRSRPLPSRSNSTAIRTAMPLVTCCVMTAPG